MSYDTPQALRMALEQRLLTRSTETGIALDRLRRRVLFERVIARIEAAEPGRWVLKGGMALEVRLHDDARLTTDVDLGLRDDIDDDRDLHDRVTDALAVDLEAASGQPARLRWRTRTGGGGGRRPSPCRREVPRHAS